MPLWTLLLALTYERWIRSSPPAQIACAVLAGISFYVHFLGAVYYPSGWNDTPVSIDEAPERAWDYRDTQIGRLSRKLVGPSNE